MNSSTKKGLLNATRVPNNTERNKIKDEKTNLYKNMNTFVGLIKPPIKSDNTGGDIFNEWLSFDNNKPVFLNKYNKNRLSFLKVCSKLVEDNVHFLKENNSLSNLSNKMIKIKKLISSLHDFIVEHEMFRETLRNKIKVQNLHYWDDYYKNNNSTNVETILFEMCKKALNGTFQYKLKACFTLIISLSLAHEFNEFNMNKNDKK